MLVYSPNETSVLVFLFLVENIQLHLVGVPIFLANRAENLL